ncbi:hypothetical protein [Spirochaeta cellobiosiphila]|uniref:hypothetical protein n=1 Tax=Spirochaeta cellobiosiphila TaxID=504483 RepID=UPI0004219D0D|nr:hypothetical protein [Spirochaeta cellobiosiphila]
MKRILGLLLIIGVMMSCATTQTESKITYLNEGFSIDTLESETTAQGHQILMMFLPTDKGFAPSVNIMTQDYSGSLEDYKKISESQFQQLGIEVIISVIDEGKLNMEYMGVLQGQDIHGYAIAIKKDNYIYLTTGTTLRSQWEKYKDQLIKVVLSFELTE